VATLEILGVHQNLSLGLFINSPGVHFRLERQPKREVGIMV